MYEQLSASVIIPTYNRAAYLIKCLEALEALNTDSSTFEILVVDNNSTDDTRGVTLKFAELQPKLCIRYICETQQGLSYGRNRGVAEANGEILCFLDDDAPPHPEWLNELKKGFVDPIVGCVGGPAILEYQGQERPPWLQADLQGLLSGYELPYGEPTSICKVAEFPFGCNMAFRKKVLNEMGFFRTDLDRSGNQVLAAGDTEMITRVYEAGWKVMYLPQAQVSHLVAPERLQKGYIYRIGKGLAKSHVLLTADPRPGMILRWFASDSWYAIRMFFKLILSLIKRNPLWFDDYMRFWMVVQRIPIRFFKILNKSYSR
jgi:glycosyltransferase involved in cell wall biosynthesis